MARRSWQEFTTTSDFDSGHRNIFVPVNTSTDRIDRVLGSVLKRELPFVMVNFKSSFAAKVP